MPFIHISVFGVGEWNGMLRIIIVCRLILHCKEAISAN